jgi:cytochrome c-type biogenesis protein CcmH/NrfF
MLAGLLAIALVSPAAALAAGARSRASFTQIEGDVMCVVCHEPLAVAQSPEAFQERDYIRGLINQGKTRRQIENDLVQQYGPAVLAKPPAHGFNLLVYVIPPVAIILGIAAVAVTLPRWRRRTRQAAALAAAAPHAAGPAFSPADARRLDDDLKREF